MSASNNQWKNGPVMIWCDEQRWLYVDVREWCGAITSLSKCLVGGDYRFVLVLITTK